MRRIIPILAFCALFSWALPSFSQDFQGEPTGVDEGTGVKQLHSLHFNVFYYNGQDSLANFIMNSALEHLSHVEEKVGYRLNGKLDLFLINNPGISNPRIEEISGLNHSITGGATAILGHRIHIDPDKDYRSMQVQLKRGIAQNLIHEMLYGGTAQERIKYATLLHLPEWFVSGLTHYVAEDWNEQLDNELRNALLHNHYKNLNKLSPYESALLGHSVWRYIDMHKGESSIRRTLYSVRISKKLESAFYFIFNQSSKQLIEEWMNYQLKIYIEKDQHDYINPQKPERLKLRDASQEVIHFDLSPNAETIAVSVYNQGRYRIIGYDREMDEISVWHEFGERKADHLFLEHQALIQWKSNTELFVLKRVLKPNQRFKTELHLLTMDGMEMLDEFDHITINSFDFDGNDQLVFTGQSDGQSVIELFDLKSRQLTRLAASTDYWSNISFSHSRQAVLFTSQLKVASSQKSSRQKKPTKWQTDIMVLLIDHKGTFTNVTSSPGVNENFPAPISKTKISYIADENGIYNAYQLDLATFEKQAITNYRLGIAKQTTNAEGNFVTELIRVDRNDYLYISENQLAKEQERVRLEPTFYRTNQSKVIEIPKIDSVKSEPVNNDLYFQIDFPDDYDLNVPNAAANVAKRDLPVAENVPYRNKLNIQSILTQVNNTNLFSDRYSPFLSPNQLIWHRYGVLLGIELSDVQHNNNLAGYVRTFPAFNQWDLRLKYDYQKNNWINGIDVWRQSNLFATTRTYQKNVGSRISYTLGHRYNSHLSVFAKLMYRNEEFVELATESQNLIANSVNQRNVGGQLKIQYEHLIQENNNTYQGIKAYVHIEQQQNLGTGSRFTEIKGEAKYGLEIQPTLFWMNRLSFASSAGSGRILYFLGGVENARTTEMQSLAYVMDANTAYFSPVYGMRGHMINARNGNSYAYLNSEVRWELGKAILKYPNPNQSIQNLMLVGFFDIGSAWYGKSPYSKDNPLNTQTFTTPVFDVTRYNPQQPVVFGLGSGLRTQLYSYFIRYDASKGWDNSVWGPVRHTFALGKDF